MTTFIHKYFNFSYFSFGFLRVIFSIRGWNVHIYVCMYVSRYLCMCYDAQCTRSLRSGCSSCVARVTSFSAMLVGMWWVWLRPAHKTLNPGTVLLPLQTGKQRPMGKPHRQPASRASLYCSFFFFSVPHMLELSWPTGSGPLAFGHCGILSLWPVSLHLKREEWSWSRFFLYVTWCNN